MKSGDSPFFQYFENFRSFGRAPELALTSTMLKKIPKSQIFAPNFQVLLKSYFCRTNLINIQVHINTYSNKTSHSNDQCSSQNIKCLPLVLLSVECNEEYKSGMLYSY